jgi:hypothetical protein
VCEHEEEEEEREEGDKLIMEKKEVPEIAIRS